MLKPPRHASGLVSKHANSGYNSRSVLVGSALQNPSFNGGAVIPAYVSQSYDSGHIVQARLLACNIVDCKDTLCHLDHG